MACPTAGIGLPGTNPSATRNVKKLFQVDQARWTEAAARGAANRANAARITRGRGR